MKKNKFFIGLVIYFGIYFIFSFILYFAIGFTFINDNDKQIIKEEFAQLEKTDILFIFRNKMRLKPTIVVVYKDNQTGEKYHSDIIVRSQNQKIDELDNKIRKNDITKYLWYINLIHLVILLIVYKGIKRKNIITEN